MIPKVSDSKLAELAERKEVIHTYLMYCTAYHLIYIGC